MVHAREGAHHLRELSAITENHRDLLGIHLTRYGATSQITQAVNSRSARPLRLTRPVPGPAPFQR